MKSFAIASELHVAPSVLASEVMTMRGVNRELGPLLRMTHPKGADRLDGSEVPVGLVLFRSWLLLFGVLPVDWSDLSFERFDGATGFQEASRLASHPVWRHQRTIEPAGDGARITDRLEFEARFAWAAPALERVVRWTFRNRHRRLRARHGGREVPPR